MPIKNPVRWLRLLVFHHDTERKSVFVCVCVWEGGVKVSVSSKQADDGAALRGPLIPHRWPLVSSAETSRARFPPSSPSTVNILHDAPEARSCAGWAGGGAQVAVGFQKKWGKPSWSHLKINNPSCKQGNTFRKIIRRRVWSSRFNFAGVIFVTLRISVVLQRWENGARTARYGCAETNTEGNRGVVRASCGPSTLALVSAERLFLGQDG